MAAVIMSWAGKGGQQLDNAMIYDKAREGSSSTGLKHLPIPMV